MNEPMLQTGQTETKSVGDRTAIWLVICVTAIGWALLGTCLYFSRNLITCLFAPTDYVGESCEAGSKEFAAVGLLRHRAVIGHTTQLKDAERYKEAADLLDGEVAKGFNTAPVLNLLAATRKNAGETDLAIAAFRKIIELNPDDLEPHIEITSLQVADKKYNEARATMQAYISRAPEDSFGYDWLSWVERNDEQHVEAVAAIDKAITRNPRFAHYYRDRAISLTALSRWDEALAGHSKSIEIEPTDTSYLNNRTELYSTLGRHEEAKNDLLKAIALADDPNFMMNLATQHRFLGEHAAADQQLSKALELDPDNFNIQNQRVYLYIDMQDYAAASKVVDALSESREPDDTDLKFLAMVIASRQGNHLEAIKGFKSILPDWPESDVLHLEIGMALVKMKAPAAALQWFDKATELGKNNSWNWSARAAAYSTLQDWPRVMADANSALEIMPGNSEALTQRAIARKATGDTAGALIDLRNAAKFEPGNLESQKMLDELLKENSTTSP
jgi:tetratricopeptide (TPR) repeat protein